MQDRWDAEKEGFRRGGMQDMRDTGDGGEAGVESPRRPNPVRLRNANYDFKKGIIRPTRCVVAVLAHQEDVLVDILVGVPVQAGLLHASHTGHGVLHSNTLDIY